MALQLQEFAVHTGRMTLAGLADTSGQKTAVIAVHGWLDNAASFIPLSRQLTLDRPFHAVELPGHGLSEHRPANAAYHAVDYILDLLAFMNTVSPDQPVVLLGHSMGGIVCSLVAAAAPERVAGLIMLDSLGPYTDRKEQVLPQLRKGVKKAMEGPSPLKVFESRELAIRARMSGVGTVTHETASLLIDRAIREVEGGFVWRTDRRLTAPSLLRYSESQVREIYAGIECPSMLISGKDGYFHQYEALRLRIPYIARLVCHDVDGGHHFHMEGDVQRTAGLIDEFVQNLSV
jgi:pimeloyl-ACP methyl ester carboxylesterase